MPPPPAVILDSILLLLLTLGSFEPSTLRSFKRFSEFDDDLALLKAFLQGRVLLFTPHTLTELSNLSNSLPSGIRIAFAAYLREVLSAAEERQLQASDLLRTPAFIYFGITDAALYILSEHAVLLTEDGRLRDFLHRQRREALNLADLRQIVISTETRSDAHVQTLAAPTRHRLHPGARRHR